MQGGREAFRRGAVPELLDTLSCFRPSDRRPLQVEEYPEPLTSQGRQKSLTWTSPASAPTFSLFFVHQASFSSRNRPCCPPLRVLPLPGSAPGLFLYLSFNARPFHFGYFPSFHCSRHKAQALRVQWPYEFDLLWTSQGTYNRKPSGDHADTWLSPLPGAPAAGVAPP